MAKEIISKEHIICVAINMEANLAFKGLYFPFILKPKVSRTNTEVRGMDKWEWKKRGDCLPITVELFFVPKETCDWGEVAGICTCSPVAQKMKGELIQY